MKQSSIYIFLAFMLMGSLAEAQKYVSRTGHINVQSSNNIKNIEGDNYQVRGILDIETGKVEFTGLLKSFEFKLGALDRVFNSKSLNVSESPTFTFEGKILKYRKIDFDTPGKYPATIKGIMYVWDEKRHTKADGMIEVMPDGKLRATSDFVITIEEKNVSKINGLIRNRLPSIVAVDLNTFGVSRDIKIKLNANFKRSNR